MLLIEAKELKRAVARRAEVLEYVERTEVLSVRGAEAQEYVERTEVQGV